MSTNESMSRRSNARLWMLALCATLAAPAAAMAAAKGHEAHDHSMHVHMPPDTAKRTAGRYSIPDTPLLSQDGGATSLAAELDTDQPVMLNFIFTTCTAICPVMSATFAEVRRELGDERRQVRFISVSIDPEHDTPATLKAYAQKYQADSAWRFLTGNYADVAVVQRAFDVYRGNKMNHVPVTFVRLSRNVPWIRYDGFVAAADLVADYRQVAALNTRP